ncbi:mannonate dehydratase [Roseibium sp. TrichSKD4]|uniref:mannonate dehydratase n=1 Tax=Roseibium sp. TrichSKD4 TaxID=744980 RepID=UPI00058D2A38|nr:mannonate dehydratase [Roseibium sp. TrichSKD4]
MIESWRWFGPEDPISLQDVRQTGAVGIVTALHDQPNGVVWPREAIRTRREMIEQAGLTWQVVESIPVHEDIKSAASGWERLAQNWAETVKLLAQEGVRTICYNFMPVLDWTRTDLECLLPDGATALRFEFPAYAAFDLFVLKREGAIADYTLEDVEAAERWLADKSDEDVKRLTDTIIAGLPGSEESYTLDQFKERLEAYKGIDREQLFQNLQNFLEIVIPAADEAGAVLAIHPDDPPRPIFGLPRIVSNLEDLHRIKAMHPSVSNGFTVCSGSLGVHADNDLPKIVGELGERVHFMHLRATRREEDPRSFYEDNHLEGDVDMIAVLRVVRCLERELGKEIPMRPDHGHRRLHDLQETSTPGYPAIGRLRGLAELRGAIKAIDHFENP